MSYLKKLLKRNLNTENVERKTLTAKINDVYDKQRRELNNTLQDKYFAI